MIPLRYHLITNKVERLPSLTYLSLTKYVFSEKPGPEFIELFSCSTQLSTKIILLKNVKMPATVGISTFISMINTTSNTLKARNVFI